MLPIPGVLFPASAVGLNPAECAVAEALKTAGYATGCIGKWHLGDQPPFLPTRCGFDYYLGIPYSNDMGLASEGSKSSLGDKLPKPKPTNPTGNDETGLRGMSQPPLPLMENEKIIVRVKQDELQGIVERYTTAAVDLAMPEAEGLLLDEIIECARARLSEGCGRAGWGCLIGCAMRRSILQTLATDRPMHGVEARHEIRTGLGTRTLRFWFSTARVDGRVLLRIDRVEKLEGGGHRSPERLGRVGRKSPDLRHVRSY